MPPPFGSWFARRQIRIKTICKCPCCSGDIAENSKAYYCTNWKNGCDFSVWKTISNATVTEDDIIDLCTRQMTFAKDFKRKTGEPYEAFLILKEDKSKKCGQSVAIKSTGVGKQNDNKYRKH